MTEKNPFLSSVVFLPQHKIPRCSAAARALTASQVKGRAAVWTALPLAAAAAGAGGRLTSPTVTPSSPGCSRTAWGATPRPLWLPVSLGLLIVLYFALHCAFNVHLYCSEKTAITLRFCPCKDFHKYFIEYSRKLKCMLIVHEIMFKSLTKVITLILGDSFS